MGGVRYRVGCLLRSQWRSALLLVVAVAAIGAVVLVLAAGAVRTATAANRYEDAQGDRFDVTMEQVEGLPRTAEVEALPAVAAVETATFVFGGFMLPNGEFVDAIAFAGSPEALAAELLDGRFADPTRPDEFVASQSFVDTAGVAIGDELELARISREAAEDLGFDAFTEGADLPPLTATLVGIIGGPAELQGDEFPLGVFPLALLEDAPVGVSASQSLVTLADGADLSDLRDQLDGLPDGDQFSLSPAEWVPAEVRDAADTQARALEVIVVIAGIAGLVVAGQLATRQVRSSDDQTVSLSSLGMTRAQIVADSLGRVGLPALVGGVLAAAVAYAFSGLFPTGFMSRLEPDPGLRVEPAVLVSGPVLLAAGLVAWVGVVLLVGARRPRRPRRASLVDTAGLRLGRARVAMGLRFAFARHGRDAGTSSTPIVGLVVLLAALGAAGTFSASLDDLLEDPARQGFTFDLTTGQGGGPVSREIVDELDADADITALALLGNVPVGVGDASLDLTGVRPVRGEFELRILSGERPTALGEVALGRKAADELGVGVGDELTVSSAGADHQLRVVGLAVVPGVEGGDGIGEGGVVNAETFRSLDPDREFGFSVTAMRLRDEAHAEATAARLSDELGIAVGFVESSAVIVNLDRVRSAPRVVAALLAALTLISLANLILITIRRRGREVAVLRSLGADRRWVAGVGHWHALVFVAAVAALAVPVGVVVGQLVFRLLSASVGSSDDTVVPLVGVLVGVGVLLVVADVVAAVALWRSRRGSIARRLAAE
ncbi:MAG: FtsX-like permease family protein [Acidimicrobiales bacterium]